MSKGEAKSHQYGGPHRRMEPEDGDLHTEAGTDMAPGNGVAASGSASTPGWRLEGYTCPPNR